MEGGSAEGMREKGEEEILALVCKILKLLTCSSYFHQLNSLKRCRPVATGDVVFFFLLR